jgi:subtilase family serine protease
LSACSTATPPTAAKRPTTFAATPEWATSSNLIGRVPSGDAITVQVHLKLRNEAQADAEIAAISDPRSPQYGHVLSDAQFEAEHAPTPSDVAALRQHLESHGLKVTYVPGNRAFVTAVGTASMAEAAFQTKLSNYGVAGETRRAASVPATVPSHLTDKVLTVAGLTTTPAYAPHSAELRGVIKRRDIIGMTPHPNAAVPADTCSEWFGKTPDTTDPVLPGYPPLTYVPCGYRPGQLRDAYGFAESVRNGNDGTGQTVAIVDAFLSPTLIKDAQTYAFNNDPDYPLADGQLTTQWAPGTPQTPDTGWYDEQTLDVEAVHASAPGAKIIAVAAQSATDQDFVAAINLIIDKKLANIISNSYGSVEATGNDFLLWNHILKIAALKGIGVYFSSGDNGDYTFSLFGPTGMKPTVSFPASSDLVTAVGGTSLALGPTGNAIFESGWEGSLSEVDGSPSTIPDGGITGPFFWTPAPPGRFISGSGGGTSLVYEQPAWQKGIVPDALANLPGVPARVVPDVAMVADPATGFLVGETLANVYSETVIGGTSLSAPLFAGTMAVAQQNAKKVFGLANPLLYAANKKGAFRDIVPLPSPEAVALPGREVIYFDYPGLTIHTAIGYDNVTGLGVPNGKSFLAAVK